MDAFAPWANTECSRVPWASMISVGSTAVPSTVISRLSEEIGAPWATATL